MFAIDASERSTVILCDCGWRAGALDRGSAWRLAADHERGAHPNEDQAAHNVALRATRAAMSRKCT